MTLEAVMLHFLDDMDAKINGVQQFIKKTGSRGIEVECLPPDIWTIFYVLPFEQMELPDKTGKKELEEEWSKLPFSWQTGLPLLS